MVTQDFSRDIQTIRDTPAVSRILDVVCRLTGMGYAAVARVTEDRWIACESIDHVGFGLPSGGELKIETTLCNEIRQHRQAIVFDDVETDDTYREHHTPRIYALRSYISVPIIHGDGRFFGTLCAIDPKPAKVNNPVVLETFKLFAEMIAYHLDAAEKVELAEASLNKLELHDQFVAVLGHDLRNPLASIAGGANLLQKEQLSEKAKYILRLMRASTARASELVDNLMDFARGRLGGGFVLKIDPERDLAASLKLVVDEMRSAHPGRDIRASIDLPGNLPVDPGRLAQMLSNLLGNAVAHGDTAREILVTATVGADCLLLSVVNHGQPIPPDVIAKMFEPFHRGNSGTFGQGLGLGLYICSEIAKAHGGKLAAESNAERTVFRFTMPMRLGGN